MTNSSTLVLASQSPRRKKILTDLGYTFEIRPSNFDERSIPESLSPDIYVAKVALGKGQAALSSLQNNEIVLASDLSVVNDGKHIHKPADLTEAAKSIKNLWNKWHVEYGACVVGSLSREWNIRNDEVRVWIPALTDMQLQKYLEISDPTDKAGGFDLACYVSLVGAENVKFEGDVSTIIGLNASSAAHLLSEFGLPNSISAQEVEQSYATEIFGV